MRRGKAQPRGQSSRWLAFAGYAALGLGCLLLGAVTFLLVAAPVELVRDRVIEQVKARTGRDLVVAGPTSLVFFPRLAISLGDVAFSAPRGMGGAPTLAVRTLEAEVGFASLFTQQPNLRRLVLTRPVFELRVDAQGRRSWDFASAAPGSMQVAQLASGEGRPQLIPVSIPAAQAAAGGGNLAAGFETLSPVSIRIAEGSARYLDERSGLRHDVTALDLDIALGAGPLQAKGSFAWRGEKVAVDGNLSSLRALIEQRSARLSLKLAGQPMEASYVGSLDVAGGIALEGNVNFKSPSVQALGNWAGRPIAAGRDAGALTLSSSLTGGGGRVSLAGLTATLGETSLTGALAIESKEARPYVSGTLKLSELDLGGILIRPNPGPDAATPDRRPPQAVPPRGPQVRGFTKRAGGGADWSDDLIDLTPLGLADANLALSADRLLYKDVKTGPVRLSLNLEDRVARLTLEEMTLYDGRGRGVVTLDGRSQAPATTANLLLDGISAQPLLKDALGFEWLEGRSTIAIALAGQGVSERQIVATLNGKVDLATTNGTIDAIDVAKILRNIEQGRFSGLRMTAGEKTPFSELAGIFTIANGIADNQDLRLVSPNVRVTGAGSFNLPARSLDYTVRPKVASLNANTDRAVINLSNVEIPVRIEGPWDKPNFSVAGQEQILEAMKEIGKNLKSKDVEEALKGLFGGGDGQPKVKPRDILEKLFKKKE